MFSVNLRNSCSPGKTQGRSRKEGHLPSNPNNIPITNILHARKLMLTYTHIPAYVYKRLSTPRTMNYLELQSPQN